MRDAENSYLNANAIEDEYDPMHQLHGSSVTYRIAVGPRQGRKVFTLQTIPASDPEEWVGKVDGVSLHAGVVAKAHERKSWSACVVILPARRYLKNVSVLPVMARCDTS